MPTDKYVMSLYVLMLDDIKKPVVHNKGINIHSGCPDETRDYLK